MLRCAATNAQLFLCHEGKFCRYVIKTTTFGSMNFNLGNIFKTVNPAAGSEFGRNYKWWQKPFLGDDSFYPYPFLNPFMMSGTAFNDYAGDRQRMEIVFKNPAVLKIFCLQCDLFSMGKVYLYETQKDGTKKEILVDPIFDLLDNPNPFQDRSQLLWDVMFYIMMGNCYAYVEFDDPTHPLAKIYILENDKIEWPVEIERRKDKFVRTDKGLKELLALQITYRYADGTVEKIPLSQIVHMADLTNGVGNWFKGPNRIEALYKVISNLESGMDTKNINLRYAGKFLVAGMADPNNVHTLPMGEPEKESIEQKANGPKQVHAIKSMIEIRRFVDNMRYLQLDEAFIQDFFIVGSEYNIPRDVLELYASSTYENQEKARGSHASYTLQPKGENFFNKIGKYFGYTKRKLQLCISWDHLPFTQVFQQQITAIQQTKISTLSNMLKLGIPLNDCNEFLETNFKTAEYVAPKTTNNAGSTAST